MAAYAALVSLMHIIEQIQNHPCPPISLDKTQVGSLTETITFLQEFLEGYSQAAGYSKEADALESRMTSAAYAAEDVIESRIVDQILAESTIQGESTSRVEKTSLFNCFRGPQKVTSHGKQISCVELNLGLQKVLEDMDVIKEEVVEIKEKAGVQDQLHNHAATAAFSRSSSTWQNTMVGCDDLLYELLDKLCGHQSSREIVPIVGMGGIGKSTLARNIYVSPLIEQHFDICAWVTISQEYNKREILVEILSQAYREDKKLLVKMSEVEVGEALYKWLSGRRYLIVLDDMWSIDVWDNIKFFFPDYNNGSRIVITTRLSDLVVQLTGSVGLEMRFLDEVESWNLLCKTVFREENCRLELKEIGKKIAKYCKGLPLSIVTIGGLLAKSKHTKKYWEYIAENLTSIVNLEDNEHCLKILHMSYKQLPVYLKPCFLYMGVFREDNMIRVSTLIKLWVSEGFLKPVGGKCLEEIGEEYLKELINRNLILVNQLGCTGKVKYCNIHDLLRDLCLREAQKERFYKVITKHNLSIAQEIYREHRVVIPKRTSKKEVLDVLQSTSLARTLICDSNEVLPSLNFKLLRILEVFHKDSLPGQTYLLENMFQFINSRYLAIRAFWSSKFPSSVYLLWNLQTLIVDNSYLERVIAPVEIWNMPQVRHVKFTNLYLPDPPSCKRDNIVLGNLQTLVKIINFRCCEEVIKRIPNIKKLEIYYQEFKEGSSYCLDNLRHLHKLESFGCSSFPETEPSGTDFLQKLRFPLSLMKLTLGGNMHVHWEGILRKIGSLPHLEKLCLIEGSFKGHEWETVEGEFRSLKFLQISYCRGLECWKTESSHFPRLEHLVLRALVELIAIPSSIGEIQTLKLIDVDSCGDSVVFSAKNILEEQVELGEVGLQVRVVLPWKNETLESLASTNFLVQVVQIEYKI